MEILYEDKYFIAVNKPSGWIVQGASRKENSLVYQLKEFLKERDKKAGKFFLAVIHRLDKPVSGVLLLAKRSKAASKFFNLIQEKRLEKVYLAKVEGKMEKDWGVWIDDLFYDEKKRKVQRMDLERGVLAPKIQRAITFYQVLNTTQKESLLFLYPFTGRKHQLRAVLSFRGFPIIGDNLYGSKIRIQKGSAILLHSLFLRFSHPYSQENIELWASIPSYFGRISPLREKLLTFLSQVKEEIGKLGLRVFL